MKKIFFAFLISCLVCPIGVLADEPAKPFYGPAKPANEAVNEAVNDSVNDSANEPVKELQVFNKDTLEVDRKYALARVLPIKVTPSGVAISLNSSIKTAHLSHLGTITIQGTDGDVCIPEIKEIKEIKCGEGKPPTAFLLRKIPHIEEFDEDQQATTDNSLMLFISTDSGLYRFQLIPDDNLPEITKVDIMDKPLKPLPTPK